MTGDVDTEMPPFLPRESLYDAPAPSPPEVLCPLLISQRHPPHVASLYDLTRRRSQTLTPYTSTSLTTRGLSTDADGTDPHGCVPAFTTVRSALGMDQKTDAGGFPGGRSPLPIMAIKCPAPATAQHSAELATSLTSNSTCPACPACLDPRLEVCRCGRCLVRARREAGPLRWIPCNPLADYDQGIR